MILDDADLAILELDPEKLRAAAPALLEEVRRLRRVIGKVVTYVPIENRKRVIRIMDE